jgi:hypothetical protein
MTSTPPEPATTAEQAAAEARDDAFADWRTTSADADAYAEHAAEAHRLGEPRADYPEFMAQRYPSRAAAQSESADPPARRAPVIHFDVEAGS